MISYDWVICGAGITGAALGYELQKIGFRVLVIEQHQSAPRATRFSYGGIPYWSGTTPLTQALGQEGLERYGVLADELEHPIGFREIDLLLTVYDTDDRASLTHSYQSCLYPPQFIDASTVQYLEPLLCTDRLQGAFRVSHAQVDPESLGQAYLRALIALGGSVVYAPILEVLGTPAAVRTPHQTYGAEGVIVCAGGMGRRLLAGSVPLFFSHAELIEIAPADRLLSTFILPANLKRLNFEATGALAPDRWGESQGEILSASLDLGGAPLLDGRMRLGQISRLHPNPEFSPDGVVSEANLRNALAELFPQLAPLPGQWHHCLVAFTADALPLVGKCPDRGNIWVFSGFTSPLVFVPPLAKRFARFLNHQDDDCIALLSPERFPAISLGRSATCR